MFKKRMYVNDALCIILSKARQSVERIGFESSFGRVLAEDIISPVEIPPFDRAAMDGYAIQGKDSFGASQVNPIIFSRINGEIGDFEASKINTGGKMPKGSDAVVMIEYTDRDVDEISVFSAVTPGKNVSQKGEDVKKGENILKKGRLLRADDVGMIAALGIEEVEVFRRPKVSIMSTGDELIELCKGQEGIIDVNSYTLSMMTSQLAIPVRLGIIPDDPKMIKDTILSQKTDLIIVSGGSSVGERDFLADIVREIGELLFHGVSLRPGGPTGFGMIGDMPIFILPGYPVAAMVAFEVFVRPLLQKMVGLPTEDPYKQEFAILKRKVASDIGRCDFVMVKLEEIDERLYAEPTKRGSSVISSMVRSDGFFIIPENKEGIRGGEGIMVNTYPRCI